jgi:hypothetical protein
VGPGQVTTLTDAFYTASIPAWRACSPGRYTYSPGDGQDDTMWLVGHVNDQNKTLTASTTQQYGYGWTCQRALTAAANIVADVLTCSNLVDDQAAVTIVRQIAGRVTGQ